MTLLDEHTRQCLAIRVARHLREPDVIDTLSDAMLAHGILEHIRSDNGPEITSKLVRSWLEQAGAQILFIDLGSPWENSYSESGNDIVRD